MEVKKETSTDKVEEADSVKLEDEEDQDDVDYCQLSLIYLADHVQPICLRIMILTT